MIRLNKLDNQNILSQLREQLELPCPYGAEWSILLRGHRLFESELDTLRATIERNAYLVAAITMWGQVLNDKMQQEIAKSIVAWGVEMQSFIWYVEYLNEFSASKSKIDTILAHKLYPTTPIKPSLWKRISNWFWAGVE